MTNSKTEKKWVKKKGCNCSKCSALEIKIEVEVEVTKKEKEKEDNKKEHDKGAQDRFEFQYDTSNLDVEIFEDPIAVLQVEFNRVFAGDRVSFSGIISLDNDTDEEVDMLLTILRTRANGATNIIYTQTFEVDEAGQDDRTQVPYAHVHVESNNIEDVTYIVRIQRLEDNVDVFLAGQSTLQAFRIS